MCCCRSMPGGSRAYPTGVAFLLATPSKMDRQRFWLMDIRRPEQSDIAIPKCVTTRYAFEGHLNGAVRQHRVPCRTLQTPRRRRCLIELHGRRVDHPQFHQCMTWLEQNLPRLTCSIMNMLEVQTGITWNKKIFICPTTFERGDTAVPTSMPR